MEPKYKLRKVLISREGLLDWPRLRRQRGMGMGMPLAMTESAKSKQGFGKPPRFRLGFLEEISLEWLLAAFVM